MNYEMDIIVLKTGRMAIDIPTNDSTPGVEEKTFEIILINKSRRARRSLRWRIFGINGAKQI